MTTWYTIERKRQWVNLLPEPIHHEKHTAALKALLPEQAGWNHFLYGVNRHCATAAEARRLTAALETHLAGVNPDALTRRDIETAAALTIEVMTTGKQTP